jgi:hypothetical protein
VRTCHCVSGHVSESKLSVKRGRTFVRKLFCVRCLVLSSEHLAEHILSGTCVHWAVRTC